MTSAIASETLRQADLKLLAETLEQQRSRAFDIVVPSRLIHVNDDVNGDVAIHLSNMDPVLNWADGVTDVNGFYVPTSVADEGFASKLGIDLRYLRRCRTLMPDLYKDNVGKWLLRDDRKFLLRLLSGVDGNPGVLRAVLSDRFGLGMDNFDVLLAMLDGMHEAGVDPDTSVIEADLTERRMIVKVTVPQLAVYADKLLENYRNPFDGTDVSRGWTPERLREVALREGQEPSSKKIFAGFVFANSELGYGAWSITPRIVVEACTNGLQLVAEAMSKRHFGGELEVGGIKWSEETVKNNMALIRSQAKDAVSTFLDVDWVTAQVEKLEEKAAQPINDAANVITVVSKRLGFTESDAKNILSHYIRGGQLTAGGVAQAITANAQVVPDGDTAYEMERVAIQAIDLAREANKLVAA